METLKITLVVKTNADPSSILDLAIEAVQSIAEQVDGEADEDQVRVEVG